MQAPHNKLTELRALAEKDLEIFIRLVHPQRVLGAVHKELIQWWNREDAKSHQLVLLPRDHGKSAMVAYRVAWEITRNPTVRVLYISSTARLAEKQLHFIKNILTSDVYQRYWPEMIDPDESKREKWTATEISVDHPSRKIEAIRDPTVFTAGLSTIITGMHCDIAVMDDVVVRDNAYNEESREKARAQYSLLSSIEGADAREWIVGTRYHPKDMYNDLLEMQIDLYSQDGELVDAENLFESFERRVEDQGDGTGVYLWPRQQRTDGKWFGFDSRILAKKRAQYLDKTQFRAQYYNDPNDPDSAAIARELFQYYDKKFLNLSNGRWNFKSNRLNVFAAVDFAYSFTKRSDFTAIVIVGVDYQNNYYILDIDRFKTDKISEYFAAIQRLYVKWGFRKIRAECTAAQSVIVQALKEQIRQNGLALSIEEFRPNKYQGAKEERIEAALEPRYENGQMWHYLGGNCSILEEELVLQNPPHDDLKDALASCITMCVPPAGSQNVDGQKSFYKNHTHKRFGGIN